MVKVNVNEIDSSPVKYGVQESGGLMNDHVSRSFESTASTDESSDDSVRSVNIIEPHIIRSNIAYIHSIRVSDV
ncbi:unnamed protein product [Rotaria sp. Silwood2]|nr:unnamed protein product [Rotaria sp. Silwood2]CAF4335553.1 unnamed protein product [Rotaria sp. Silwood2]